MEKNYWERFYSSCNASEEASPFANFVLENFIENKPEHFLLELGCGNGRDCLFFNKNTQLNLLGIDQCSNEISHLNKLHASDKIQFDALDFTNLPDFEKEIHYIYSRFTLHAVDKESESRVLKWSYDNLAQDGLFFIECRSIKDDLYNVGKKVAEHAFVTTHYRRFVDYIDLQNELSDLGFEIIYALESRNLAVYNEENPVVIRVIAKNSRKF